MEGQKHVTTTALLREKLLQAGLPDAAVRTFLFHYSRLSEGSPTTLGRDEIEAVERLPDGDALAEHGTTGRSVLNRVVTVKLNGGLGTGMGLARAKSLLDVRSGLSFLDLIARQALSLRDRTGIDVPLLMMNSFRTQTDSIAALAPYPGLQVGSLPLGFLQHKVPKILAEGLGPALHPDDPELEWCPPGHGDVYTALSTSGVLDQLLDRGIDYAFLSNADNLGAILDPAILGYMVAEGLDFILEAADRTPADRKGGHLCRLVDGRLALRESAQCPADEEGEFQDVTRYRFFNANNLWIHLPTLQTLLDVNRGVLPLHTIINRKTVDPSNPQSAPVLQLETAMGSAISLFPKAAAVRVNRRRFSPVKNTDDLLGVRSDAYVLTASSTVTLHPDRTAPPTVRLDPRYFKMIGDFEQRFPKGAPSLKDCESLTVTGDVTFGAGVVVRGNVIIEAEGKVIPDGTVLEGK